MIPLSPRYAVPLLGLALFVAMPAWLHASRRLEVDDCRDPEAFARMDDIPATRIEEGRRSPRVHLLEQTGGIVVGPDRRRPFHFAVLRSFDPVQLYLQPVTHFEADERSLAWMEGGGARLPYHWLIDRSKSPPRFAAYVFLYNGEPVASPLAALFADVPGRLLSRTPPLTLALVRGDVTPGDAARATAEDWLLRLWTHYRDTCR